MYQTAIDAYGKVLEEKLQTYLASLPDPSQDMEIIVRDGMLPTDNKCHALPVEFFDIAGATALIRNHKDSKGKYEPNSYLVEMLTVMFRAAIHHLGWWKDKDASNFASNLAYDAVVKAGTDFEWRMIEFDLMIRKLPYSVENQVWYSFMLPLLAYTRQGRHERPHYLVRYLVSVINKFGLMDSVDEHLRDVNVDTMRALPHLGALLEQVRQDRYHAHDFEFVRNVISEYAQIHLACMLRRGSEFLWLKTLAHEFVSYHYLEYQETSQIYFNRKQEGESK